MCLACCWQPSLHTLSFLEFCMCFFLFGGLCPLTLPLCYYFPISRPLKTILWILKCLWDYALQYYHHLGWFQPSSCCSHHQLLLFSFDFVKTYKPLPLTLLLIKPLLFQFLFYSALISWAIPSVYLFTNMFNHIEIFCFTWGKYIACEQKPYNSNQR